MTRKNCTGCLLARAVFPFKAGLFYQGSNMGYSARNMRYLAEQAGIVYVCQDERTLQIQLRRRRNVAEIHYQVALHIAEQLELESRFKAFSLSELRKRLQADFASLFRRKMIRPGATVRFALNAPNHVGLAGVILDTEVSWTRQGLPIVMLHMENEVRGTYHCVAEVLLYTRWIS